jgi:hypothetical protein
MTAAPWPPGLPDQIPVCTRCGYPEIDNHGRCLNCDRHDTDCPVCGPESA